jgi:hypothetical protein
MPRKSEVRSKTSPQGRGRERRETQVPPLPDMLTEEEIAALQEDKRRATREFKGAFLHLRSQVPDQAADAAEKAV